VGVLVSTGDVPPDDVYVDLRHVRLAVENFSAGPSMSIASPSPVSMPTPVAAEQGADVIGDLLRHGDEPVHQRPWSELITVESVEVEAPVVTATARPADLILGGWQNWIPTRAVPGC
jgi:hypothetical protein